MTVHEDEAFSRLFPAERWARVRVTLADGRTVASTPAVARGSAENPLTDAELLGKYRSYAEPVLGKARAARIEHAVHRLGGERADLSELLDDLLQPIP
jgi:2-methylcitrate dehydratase PrpD